MSTEIKLGIIEIQKLMRLLDRVAKEHHCRPSGAVGLLEANFAVEVSTRSVCLPDFVAAVRHLRMRRNDSVGASLFRDPAWDMLLELFTSHERGQDVSVSSLCHASGVPITTALRHIDRLEAHGMAFKEGDEKDERRLWIRPTEKSLNYVAKAAAALAEQAFKAIEGYSVCPKSETFFAPRSPEHGMMDSCLD